MILEQKTCEFLSVSWVYLNPCWCGLPLSAGFHCSWAPDSLVNNGKSFRSLVGAAGALIDKVIKVLMSLSGTVRDQYLPITKTIVILRVYKIPSNHLTISHQNRSIPFHKWFFFFSSEFRKTVSRHHIEAWQCFLLTRSSLMADCGWPFTVLLILRWCFAWKHYVESRPLWLACPRQLYNFFLASDFTSAEGH